MNWSKEEVKKETFLLFLAFFLFLFFMIRSTMDEVQ